MHEVVTFMNILIILISDFPLFLLKLRDRLFVPNIINLEWRAKKVENHLKTSKKPFEVWLKMYTKSLQNYKLEGKQN